MGLKPRSIKSLNFRPVFDDPQSLHNTDGCDFQRPASLKKSIQALVLQTFVLFREAELLKVSCAFVVSWLQEQRNEDRRGEAFLCTLRSLGKFGSTRAVHEFSAGLRRSNRLEITSTRRRKSGCH